MGCQQSKAKEQPTQFVAPKPTPAIVAPTMLVKMVDPMPSAPIVPEREDSPVATLPTETTLAPSSSSPRSEKSVSVISSIASNVTPSLEVIFKHRNLDAMIKRWNQRMKADARHEAARCVVSDVLGEQSLAGMFRPRSLTPAATTPAQQDLFCSLLNSFASPPREWSASPRRQFPASSAMMGSMSPVGSPRTGLRAPQPTCVLEATMGSMSPIGSPRTGLRAPQPTCVLEATMGSMSPVGSPRTGLRAPQPTCVLEATATSMPTPDDLIADLLLRSDSDSVVMREMSPRAEKPMMKESVSSPFSRRSISLFNTFPPASPKRETFSASSPVKASLIFGGAEAQGDENSLAVLCATPKAVVTCTSSKSMTPPKSAAKSQKKSAKKVTHANKNGPVASRWEKGSQAQMQTDIYMYMMKAFERQMSNRTLVDNELAAR